MRGQAGLGPESSGVDSNEQIYRELIEPVEERMVRAIARLLRDPDDAADALQNALASIWKRRAKIRKHANPPAYILSACISASYDLLRKRARERRREKSFDGASVPNPASPAANQREELFRREFEEQLLRQIGALPRKQAVAVTMRIVEEESFVAIAQSLGCSEVTARSHVSKGRARLKQTLMPLLERRSEEAGPKAQADD